MASTGLNKGKGRAAPIRPTSSSSSIHPTLFSSETLTTSKRKRKDGKHLNDASRAEHLGKSRAEALSNCRPRNSKTHIPIRSIGKSARVGGFSRKVIADSDSDSELLKLTLKRHKVFKKLTLKPYLLNMLYHRRVTKAMPLKTTTLPCLSRFLSLITAAAAAANPSLIALRMTTQLEKERELRRRGRREALVRGMFA